MHEFYKPNMTWKLFMKEVDKSLIVIWDMVWAEVDEVLVQSCDIYAFIDDYMQLSYGSVPIVMDVCKYSKVLIWLNWDKKYGLPYFL